MVPAHNEERLIGAALDAINAAARSLDCPFELVVVDDASTDRTAEIARERGARVVPVERRHIAAVRNAGAMAAKGDTFIFVDADTHVNTAVVAAALEATGQGAVGGGCAVLWDGRVPRWGRVLASAVLRTMRLCRWAAGCFLFCTREAFARAGGFDERLYAAEEIAISQALKRQGEFVILRGTVVTSGRKMRLYSFWEVLRMGINLSVHRLGVPRSRRQLELWYGERRNDD